MGTGKCFSAELLPGGDPGAPIVAALAYASQFAATTALSASDRDMLALVVEELVSNSFRHGAGERGIRLAMTLSVDPDEISIVIEDDGVAFDPTANRAFEGPDRDTGGGVGIVLVKAWAQRFAYTRTEGKNRLELALRFDR